MKHAFPRFLSLILVAVMLFSLFPASAFSMADDVLPATAQGEEAAASLAAQELPAEAMDAVTSPVQTMAAGDLAIPGYSRVTEMPSGGLETGKYLIIATYDNNYYMLYPGATGAGTTANNSARLEVGENGVATGYKVGCGTNYDSATAATDFSTAENTIVKNSGADTYSVTATQAGGSTTYYLFNGTSPVYQSSSPSTVTILAPTGDNAGYFHLKHSGGSWLIFYKDHMNFNQNSSINNTNAFGNMMLFRKDPPLPGYSQIASVAQLRSDRKYLIVSQAPDKTFYALYLNSDGQSKNPGAKGHPECTATLSVSDGVVSAVSTANTATAIPMDDLLVNVVQEGGKYAFKNDTLALMLAGAMYESADVAPHHSVSVVDGNRFEINNTNQTSRYLTFNVKGATSTETHFPAEDTGFCGWNDRQTQYRPIYIFIQGELPTEPGVNLTQMLSGDQIGGGNTENADPAGQNSWVFTGGRAAQGSFTDVAGARTWAGHFEEYVRYTNAKQLQPSGEATTPYFQRHVINAAYEGQMLQNIVDTFDTRIAPLKPRAVTYLVDENGSTEANFAENLNTLITKAMTLQNGTGMIVIQTLTAADKAAVDAVVDALSDEQRLNVLPILSELTAAQKTNGYPNAQGHLEMAKKLADAVAGTTVSTAANWPYGAISGSVMAADFPTKATVNVEHTDFSAPESPTAVQTAIKTKVEADTSMTWLFMGDSITHGSAWTGGYDTLAQLFEKFVKDDLGRRSDVIINAGSSGATTASTINDLNRRLVKYDPDVVVLMLGTNDTSGGISETAYKANLRTILDKIIAKNAVAVLRTPPPTSRNYDIATYAGYVRDVAEESAYTDKVILVDQYARWTSSNWGTVFSRDALHPDEAGHLWFAHQLINDMGLWKDDADICALEYVEQIKPLPLELPGYTRITSVEQVQPDKAYLIVSQVSDGRLYAFYPSSDSLTAKPGALNNLSTPNAAITPNNPAIGTRTAILNVTETEVTATWMKDSSAISSMADLLFTIEAASGDDAGKHIFTAVNGKHLNMTNSDLFSDGNVALSFENRSGTTYPGSFVIKNTASNRSLTFNFTGDATAFGGSNWGTDFWCPGLGDAKAPLYLFQSNETAKDQLVKLIAQAKAIEKGNYTNGTWAALQNAIAAAEALVADSAVDGDAPECGAARTALLQSMESLIQNPAVPTVPAGATKKEIGDMRPANGTTENQPFPTNTGGSKNFRIPAMITLRHQQDASKNGRLVAAIDARWNHTADAQNLDTIVSYSDDDGANWNYNFANYFGDSTDTQQAYSSSFIDPQLTEGKDGTIYLMVDLYPAYVAITGGVNQPHAATGYTEISGKQRLVLYTTTTAQTGSNYAYYVGDFADGYAPVYEYVDGGAGDLFSGFYVDAHYYLYQTAGEYAAKTPDNDKIWCERWGETNTWVQQNVFFYRASLHVRNASYLWIVTSTDGGETWGDPIMNNDQVRTGADVFYGVGPGAGLCVDTEGSTDPNAIPDGMLVLPVYTFSNQISGFIYSTDNGATWHRGNDATTSENHSWSGENCLVQIDDVTIRHFYRDNKPTLYYTDHTWNGNAWQTGTPVNTNVAKTTSVELSAIQYSKKVNGKDVLLVSTPTGSGGNRNTGKIYTFLVNNDEGHTMELFNSYSVTEAGVYYCYSSLTETTGGDIALLYEDSWSSSPSSGTAFFKIIPIEDLIPIDSEPTGVTLNKTEVTLYTNAAETAERMRTVQLTATVLPPEAEQTVTWMSSDTAVATVNESGLVTAVSNGVATITAAVTGRDDLFAACKVTVSTRIEGITVKKDGVDLGSTPVRIYTNADHPNHSAVLTAETTPENITHPQLDWTRPEGAKGQITLSKRGENGHSITITAVPGEKNVGETTVEVASADHPDTKTAFKVHVIRLLENNVTISIQGVNDPAKAPQYGQVLEADINDLQMTDAGKQALTYQWKRTTGGTTTAIENATAKTYTLTPEDIGATISVDVTAGADSFYEGTRSAIRSQLVERADGPLTGPQNLIGTAPTDADAADGSITGFDANFADYEYHLVGTVDTDWHDVTAQTVTDLTAGTYQVRLKETATHKAGGFSVVTVPAAGAVTYTITLDTMTNGRVSRSDSVAEENAAVTLTVLPETGYKLTANGLSVEKADGSEVSVTKVTGRDNEYTFAMPAEAVTVKATFEQLTFTVSHELTNLHCSLGAADGHQVAYGASTAVTLQPNAGYVLPLRKDIHVYTLSGTEITGWTISDNGVITITGGVTNDLIIVAAARSAIHTVNYTLTNGLKKSQETTESANHMEAYTGVLEAEVGFELPETIVVTVDGSLIGAENYLYNKETGEISISAGRIYGNVVIIAAGVPGNSEIVPVKSVTLNRATASVTVGSTVRLIATVNPEDATNQGVVWSSADTDIAAVDENGVVTAISEGTTTITVITLDGRKTATCTITVTKRTPSSNSSSSSTPSTSTTVVTGEDGSKVTTVTTKGGDKTITVTDPEGEEIIKVEIPAVIPETEEKFEDLDSVPWAEESVNKVAALELVKGVGGNKYDPVAPMTRGSLATVLHRLSQGKTDYEVAFKDVAKNKYYTEGVAWAAKVNVVTGYTAEIFAPDDIITREQLAVMLARYAKLLGMDTTADAESLDQFVDADATGAWAVDGVAWCVEKGLLKGKGMNNLDPTAEISRAEVAVLLDRFIALIK